MNITSPRKKVPYVSGYKGARPLEEQRDILVNHFPQLANILIPNTKHIKIPKEAEGLFLIFSYRLLSDNPYDAVLMVCEEIKKKVSFLNLRKEYINSLANNERKRIKTPHFITQMNRLKGRYGVHSYWVVPAQFGALYQGWHPERVSKKVLKTNEFCFDMFRSLIITLTHLERFKDSDDLWVYCPGEECEENNQKKYPLLYKMQQNLTLGIGNQEEITNVISGNGSITGWIP